MTIRRSFSLLASRSVSFVFFGSSRCSFVSRVIPFYMSSLSPFSSPFLFAVTSSSRMDSSSIENIHHSLSKPLHFALVLVLVVSTRLVLRLLSSFVLFVFVFFVLDRFFSSSSRCLA